MALNQVLLHSRPPALNIRIFYIIQGINNPFYAYLSPSSLYKIPIKCIENDRIQTNGFLFFLSSKLIANLMNLFITRSKSAALLTHLQFLIRSASGYNWRGIYQ